MHKTLALCAALGFLAAPVLLAGAAAAAPLSPAACPASAALTRLDAPLPRLALRLASGEPVVIVAIGSSSTAGAGATGADFSYPMRMQFALRELFPGRSIKVINRGVNGQDGPEMLARFDTDVASLNPTLVIWQSGVNALFREGGLAGAGAVVREAIARTRAIGSDFLIVDPQYAPRVLADADSGPMVSLLSEVAAQEKVPVFHRFALMRDWHERGGMPFEAFLWKDRFHMNDWSYDCLGKDLARSIAANVNAQQRSAEIVPQARPAAVSAGGVKAGGVKSAVAETGSAAIAVPAAAPAAVPAAAAAN